MRAAHGAAAGFGRGLMLGCVLLLGCTAWVQAARLPVLDQIDVPHPYYFREMYLPQLTSGPSGLTWSPDSSELIYSMAGSLWRQTITSGTARQLTVPDGYDYQPDWSSDGRWVVYSSYSGSAVDLWMLDLNSGEAKRILSDGAVNLEPRFSPDGRRIVFVSTAYHRRFHVFTADVDHGSLSNIVRLTGESKSTLRRYYYSAYDHEINPVWTRDGRSIVYVSNRNHLYGTGGFWRIAADRPGADRGGTDDAVEIHYEETNWRARPDTSPDGSRLVFSSYLGRSWHNLWLLPVGGGDAFPLTYGDWDQTSPRWSPDGGQIAFISNRHANTSIGLLSIPGAARPLAITERQYLGPMSRVHLNIRDDAGRPAAARISIVDGRGRFHAPADAWIHGDEGFDRGERRFEAHYFHGRGEQWIDIPAGAVSIDITHGLERRFEQRRLRLAPGETAEVAVEVDRQALRVPAAGHWISADVHVHMNYGGAYRNTPENLGAQARAEHLDIVNELLVNKEQRYPDVAYNGERQVQATPTGALVVFGQEYHTSYWGHLGLIGLGGGVILPGYAGYPNTAASSLSPMNADVADLAHARGALVGYAHPFDEYPEPVAKPGDTLTNELPVDVALGKIDYLEVMGFSDHRATARVWYQLLNLGFRIPAAAGTDTMANYASLHGPVGMSRVYLRVPDGPVESTGWQESLKRGHSFVTNGPLLSLTLDAAGPGDELAFATAPRSVKFSIGLRSLVAVDQVELVCNGAVVRSLVRRGPVDHGDFSGSIPLRDSGWCVARASTDGGRYPVMDNYVYASTSPIYVTIAGRAPHSPTDARYFAAWIDRLMESTSAYPDWNDGAERTMVLKRLESARAVFQRME